MLEACGWCEMKTNERRTGRKKSPNCLRSWSFKGDTLALFKEIFGPSFKVEE